MAVINKKFETNVFFPNSQRELVNKSIYVIESDMEFEMILGIDLIGGLPLKFKRDGTV